METKLKNNLPHVRIAISRMNSSIDANKAHAIERHLSGLKEHIAETGCARRECEAKRLEQKKISKRSTSGISKMNQNN